MSSSLKTYLAEKYMSGPKADAILAREGGEGTKKKKKRKPNTNDAGTSASFIKDNDDALTWGAPTNKDDEDVEMAVVEKDRTFKKRKVDPNAGSGKDGGGGGWITVREPTPPPAGEEEAEDDKPTVVEPLAGGLVTAGQFRSTLPQPPPSKSSKGKEKDRHEDEQMQQETVYRDSSGRRIDTKAERAAAARERRVREEKEAQKMEWGKGLVQREEKERKKLEEEKEKKRGLARYADDDELNEIQKAQDRWNDPAAAFLTKKEKKGPKRPAYKGPPPPPNRFGIMPGYRWDGVDRGNGFEKKLFQRANERKRGTLEAYQWSVDEM